MDGAVGVSHFGVSVIGICGGCLWVGGPICVVGGVVFLFVGFVTVVEVTGSPFVSGSVSI